MMGRVDIIVGLHYTARLLDHSCCNSLLKQTNCYLVGLVWVRLRGEKNKRKREKKTMTMAFLVRKKQQQQRKRKRKRKREEMEDVEFNWVSMWIRIPKISCWPSDVRVVDPFVVNNPITTGCSRTLLGAGWLMTTKVGCHRSSEVISEYASKYMYAIGTSWSTVSSLRFIRSARTLLPFFCLNKVHQTHCNSTVSKY